MLEPQLARAYAHAVQVTPASVKFSIVDMTTQIVAAVTGSKILVLAAAWQHLAGAASVITFKSATTAISPGFTQVGTNTEDFLVLPLCQWGWFATASGEALQITTTGAGLHGLVVYAGVAA